MNYERIYHKWVQFYFDSNNQDIERTMIGMYRHNYEMPHELITAKRELTAQQRNRIIAAVCSTNTLGGVERY